MFETFEHKADIGVRGKGKSVSEAFSECAKAMFSVIANIGAFEGKEADELKMEAENLEELLVKFLSELLYLQDTKKKIYNKFNLYITEDGGEWKLKGKAFGEKIEAKHCLKGEVKAATWHQLKVEEEGGQWLAQCVVDV